MTFESRNYGQFAAAFEQSQRARAFADEAERLGYLGHAYKCKSWSGPVAGCFECDCGYNDWCARALAEQEGGE